MAILSFHSSKLLLIVYHVPKIALECVYLFRLEKHTLNETQSLPSKSLHSNREKTIRKCILSFQIILYIGRK